MPSERAQSPRFRSGCFKPKDSPIGGRSGAEEAPTLGPICSTAKRGHRPATDGLGLHLGGGPVKRRRLDRPLKVIGILGDQEQRKDQSQGTKTKSKIRIRST